VRVEELLAGGEARALLSPAAPSRPATAAPPRPTTIAPPPATIEPRPAPVPRATPAAEAAPAEATAPPPARPAPERKPSVAEPAPPKPEAPRAPHPPADAFTTFLEEVSARRPPLAAHLDGAKLTLDGQELLVYLPAGQGGGVPLKALERPSNRMVMDEAVARVWGPGMRWRAVAGAGPAAESPPSEPRAGKSEPTTLPDAGLAEAEQLQIVTDLREILGGTVVGIRPRDEGREE
jgi:hypothetical protein